MSLTNSKLSVETIIPEGNITYYVTLQAANTGKSAVDYVSPLLTYNTGLGSFFVNNRVVPTSNVSSLGSIVTSPTPPPNPAVGDLWYDSSSDIQFEYVNDGVNRQWVDITGPTMSIGGPVSTNNFTYLPLTAIPNSITTINVTPGGSVNFSTYTSVTGGYTASPYIYYIVSGTLPSGLNLGATSGVISGTTTAVESINNVTFGVRDATGYDSPAKLTVNIRVLNSTITLSYLAVGGGGGGGGTQNATSASPSRGQPGGGGGGGGVLQGPTTLIRGTTYTIIVGAGGAGGLANNPLGNIGNNGANSSISGSGFTTIDAFGGGGGGGGGGTSGIPGGSGGGGGTSSCGQFAAGLAIGSAGQGAIGTQGWPAFTGPGGAGGGGGAGATATGPTGAGGIGYTWPFTASTYGGGGSARSVGPSPGGGGRGVSGITTGSPTPGQENGSASTGGGGGVVSGTGVTPYNFPGGQGGSGVVILAVPNFAYTTITAPGATISTPGAAPGMTVLTYTAPTPGTPSSFTLLT